MAKHISPYNLELSDDEIRNLIFSMALHSRHLSQVNMYLLCAVLETSGGLSRDDIDDILDKVHASVRDHVDRKLVPYEAMPENLRRQILEALSGGRNDGPRDET